MDCYLGEVRLVAFDYAPFGWALCQGQKMPISQNQALYSLIGTIYGGDVTNFCLPKLIGRVPISQGTGAGLTQRTAGQTLGSTSLSLQQTQMPAHTHVMNAVTQAGASSTPGSAATAQALLYYTEGSVSPNPADITLGSGTLSTQIGALNLDHDNIMPTLTLNYIIAIQGIFPSKN
ncbi:phage tail protein [Pararhodospirillum photometricum]|uniref:phage tail protein n=1 Tax=Pararhodospirillum photometricum TaxID=1084 RepID=UPI0002D74511|nr:tail fiber protein [Pararhodospirillum photometricum]